MFPTTGFSIVADSHCTQQYVVMHKLAAEGWYQLLLIFKMSLRVDRVVWRLSCWIHIRTPRVSPQLGTVIMDFWRILIIWMKQMLNTFMISNERFRVDKTWCVVFMNKFSVNLEHKYVSHFFCWLGCVFVVQMFIHSTALTQVWVVQLTRLFARPPRIIDWVLLVLRYCLPLFWNYVAMPRLPVPLLHRLPPPGFRIPRPPGIWTSHVPNTIRMCLVRK